jgi:hypothetical protein
MKMNIWKKNICLKKAGLLILLVVVLLVELLFLLPCVTIP